MVNAINYCLHLPVRANAFGIHVILCVQTYRSLSEKCRLDTAIFLALSNKIDVL